MKIKYLLILFALVSSQAFSQAIKLQAAYNYLNSGKYDKAKEAIDQAVIHEQTGNSAKTWFYAGAIYLNIYLNNKVDTAALATSKKNYFKALSLDSNNVSYLSYGINPKTPDFALTSIGEEYYNLGAGEYNKPNYPQAIKDFATASQIKESHKGFDTLSCYYTALAAKYMIVPNIDAAEKTKYSALSKDNFTKLFKIGYQKYFVYTLLTELLMDEGNLKMADEVIQKGKSLFPDNSDIGISEVNLNLKMGEGDKALANLINVIKLDPNNARLYFVAGVKISEFLTDSLYKKNPKQFDVYMTDAEKYFTQSLAIDNTQVEVQFNLGALYANSAAVIVKFANNLPYEDKRYPDEKQKADNISDKAIAALERCLELSPNEMAVLSTLKSLYVFKNRADKAAEIDKKIQQLQK